MTEKNNLDNPLKISHAFNIAHDKCLKWLENMPTGQFILHVNINEGGIRGKPKMTIIEDQ